MIQSEQPLRKAHVTHFVHQILKGVQYLHGRSILHRDLKPANILVNEDCSVRVADLGLARLHDDATNDEGKTMMTEYVVSRWWRAPEVMVSVSYSFEIDVWFVGTIMAELLLIKPVVRRLFCIMFVFFFFFLKICSFEDAIMRTRL